MAASASSRRRRYCVSSSIHSREPANFVVAPTYSDQMRVALNWISEDAGGASEVAVFHHDSPFGQAPVADGEAWVEDRPGGGARFKVSFAEVA